VIAENPEWRSLPPTLLELDSHGEISDLIPSAAMVVPDGELEAVGRDTHAVIEEAKAAGVYVFAGGIDESVPPVLASAAAPRSYECSGSIPLRKVDGTSHSSSRGTVEQCAGATTGERFPIRFHG